MRNTKKHFQYGPIITICGVHFATENFVNTSDFNEVTCGNCLRKALVFKSDLSLQTLQPNRRKKRAPSVRGKHYMSGTGVTKD